jgi:hypothetical protein
MMLRGMGFSNTTQIFLAAGKIYNEEESMEPLRRMFPYLETKQTLLSPEEYAPFEVLSCKYVHMKLYSRCSKPEEFSLQHVIQFMTLVLKVNGSL